MKIFKNILVITLVAMVAISGCKKVAVGFLSDNVFYRSNPFVVEQGVVSYSSPLQVDGSTAPISVTLLDVRDKSTGQSVMAAFLQEQEVTTFTGEITSEDNTLEKLNQKLIKKMVKPFNINPIGGRIEFSAASKYLPVGTYEMDIAIKNVKGSKIITNACDLVVKEPATAYNFIYKAWTVSSVGEEVFLPAPGDPDFSITWDLSGPNEIELKWVDKYGTTFNPKAGEIIHRGDRPTFSDWDPYYPEEKTDSSIIFKYPETGLPFPLQTSITLPGGSVWNDGICYYRITGGVTDINMNINPVHTIKYLQNGRYVVTFHLYNAVHL